MDFLTFFRWTVAALLISVLPPLAAVAWSTPTIACHCFQDRQFDPARPGAVDPYLLATVQNRLIGYLYAQPRQEIVRSKMGGVSGDRLWIASQVAVAARRSTADALQARTAAGSWRDALLRLGADPERLGPTFMARLAAGAEDAALAEAVVDRVLATRLGAGGEAIVRLRLAGAGNREVVAAVVFGRMAERDPEQVHRQADSLGSWGQWLIEAGFTLEQVDAWLAGVLRP